MRRRLQGRMAFCSSLFILISSTPRSPQSPHWSENLSGPIAIISHNDATVSSAQSITPIEIPASFCRSPSPSLQILDLHQSCANELWPPSGGHGISTFPIDLAASRANPDLTLRSGMIALLGVTAIRDGADAVPTDRTRSTMERAMKWTKLLAQSSIASAWRTSWPGDQIPIQKRN
jgi:hypothetical protein